MVPDLQSGMTTHSGFMNAIALKSRLANSHPESLTHHVNRIVIVASNFTDQDGRCESGCSIHDQRLLATHSYVFLCCARLYFFSVSSTLMPWYLSSSIAAISSQFTIQYDLSPSSRVSGLPQKARLLVDVVFALCPLSASLESVASFEAVLLVALPLMGIFTPKLFLVEFEASMLGCAMRELLVTFVTVIVSKGTL